MPSSGRIAATSWIPPVSVEPIPPLDDMASIKDLLYCRREFLMKNGLIDKKVWPRGMLDIVLIRPGFYQECHYHECYFVDDIQYVRCQSDL